MSGLPALLEHGLWLVAAVSLYAVWLNIKGQAACFVLWAWCNAVWIWVDLDRGIHAQAALQACYLALSIYGIYRWSKLGHHPAAHGRED